MPVISVNLEDFNRLAGRDFTVEHLQERLPLMGCAWERLTEDGFEIEVFPNRPDLLSVEGLAKAFAAFEGIELESRSYTAKPSDYRLIVDESIEPVRPYIVSAVVKGITFTDDLIRSIIQMQEKLHITHCRNRRKGSIGLHALPPIQFPLTYTAKPENFRFIPLDERREMSLEQILKETPKGVEYAWILEGKQNYPILMDAKGMVLSMPPIINSTHTRITEDTTDIFIDVTGTDEKTIVEVLNIISTTFADRGATIYSVKNVYPNRTMETPDLAPTITVLDHTYVNSLLGLNLSAKEVADYLKRMGHSAEVRHKQLSVDVPCYRADVMHPIDLVEEVAIAYGYDKFVPEIPKISTVGSEEQLEVFSRHLRGALPGYGLVETITFILSNREKLFSKMAISESPIAETENPKTEEYCVMRNWLLPSLMEVLNVNRHHPYPQNLYEVGDVILIDPNDNEEIITSRRLAVVLCHSRASFSESKAMAENILRGLGLKDYQIAESHHPTYIDGRAFDITTNGVSLCTGGEVRPEVLANWSLEMPVTAFEMDVDLLFKHTVLQ